MASGVKKPATLIMGLHHAREWIADEVPLALINKLTQNYATDARIKSILDNYLFE